MTRRCYAQHRRLSPPEIEQEGRYAGRALQLARSGEALPQALVADAALTMAHIARDRDDLVGCRAHLEYAITLASNGDRLGWALVGLGPGHPLIDRIRRKLLAGLQPDH